MDNNILGKRLKILRTENNLTQEEFGKPYNLKKSTISQYESGSSKPDDELKKRIAKDFSVSLDWLLGVTDIRNPYENKYLEEDPQQIIKLEDDLIELMIKHGIIPDKDSVNEKHIEFIKYAIETYKNEQNNR